MCNMHRLYNLLGAGGGGGGRLPVQAVWNFSTGILASRVIWSFRSLSKTGKNAMGITWGDFK